MRLSRFASTYLLLIPLAIAWIDPRLAAEPPATGSNPFLTDFQKHWRNAGKLAVAVGEEMPAKDYDFKPNPDEMTFGELMVHVAESNEGYCSALLDAKPTFKAPSPITREAAVQAVANSFADCTKIFEQLKDADLDRKHGDATFSYDSREVLFGLLVHMAHHRGQAEVYLRVKGFKPPAYTW